MEKISSGIGQIVQKLSPAGGEAAARAILTTDTVIKMSAYRVQVDGERLLTLGMAKGSGMIVPIWLPCLLLSLPTLRLKESLQKALRQAVGYTFNLITVDGDTSTNDMVLLLANGFSGVQIRRRSPLWEVFCEALFTSAGPRLQIVSDGEGATKVVKLTIKGVPDYHTGRFSLARY